MCDIGPIGLSTVRHRPTNFDAGAKVTRIWHPVAPVKSGKRHQRSMPTRIDTRAPAGGGWYHLRMFFRSFRRARCAPATGDVMGYFEGHR